MKQIIILAVVFVSAFGAKLNQYLPPRPETHNIQFQPPALPNSGGQPFDIGNLPQPFTTSKVSEQSGQSPGPFEQFAQKTQYSLELGQLTQKSVNGIPEQSSIPFGQKNTFNTNNGSPTRQYLTPINKDTSGQSSNSIVELQNPRSGSNRYNEDEFKGFVPQSEAQNTNSFGQFPNKIQGYNGPSINGLNQPTGEFNGQYPGAQSNVASQLAPIGLIRSEINPDVGDGHYSYLYETENGITAQEEGFETNNGKSAQGSFSYTSPEGEQITLEYTADANGFVPKGSHVPEIPEAIAKSIELNKAAEARGEYNEGSYRDEYNDESNGNQGKTPFNSFKVPNAYGNQNNVNQNSGPARNNNVADQGTFASEENKQFSPIVQQNNAIPSYDQKINGVPETLGHQSYESKTPFGQKRIQQYNKSPFGQQTNGPKTSIVQQTNGPKSSLGQNNGGNNGYQYSAPGNTNFANQGTFVSEENKQVSPIGQQNNVVSSYNQNINGVPETIRRQSYESQTPFGQKGTQQYNNNLQSPFGEQNIGPKTSFGQHNGPRYSALGKASFTGQGTFASEQLTLGQQNVPSTSYKQQNRAPSTYFEQQNNELKSVSKSENNGYQFPGQEQNFATQHNKPFRTQISTTSTQFAPKYETPGKAPPTNNFSFQTNESKGHSGQYGTVQDNQGGYKY